MMTTPRIVRIFHWAPPQGPTLCGVDLDELPEDEALSSRQSTVTCPDCRDVVLQTIHEPVWKPHRYQSTSVPGWRTCALCGQGANATVHRSAS